MKVSVIITNYNKAPYLKEAILSAINQTYENKEILIIDDGSTDNSHEIIKQFEQNELVRTIYQENRGVIYTRNYGIQASKGDYIVQLDGDDILHLDFLTWTVQEMESDSNVGIVFCLTERFGKVEGIWDLGTYSLKRQLTTNLIVITALFRRSDYFRTKGYRDAFKDGLEDWDFWLSIIELGRSVVEVPKIGFYYRILEISRNNSYTNSIQKNLKKKIFEHHKDLYLDNGFDPVNLLWEKRKLKDEIKSLKLVKESREYRLGKVLLKPFRFIQKIIK